MGTMTIEILLEKYGTNGISAMLRTLYEGTEELSINSYRQTATREMAEDLEKALDEYKEHTKG